MNKQTLPLALLAIVLAAILVVWYQNGEKGITVADSRDEIAHIIRFIPDVTVFNTEIDSIVEANQPVFSRDTLFTNTNGYAMLLFIDESIAKITPNSQMVISGELNGDKTYNRNTNIQLSAGSLFFDIQPQQQDSRFTVTTTRTVASVKGTRFGINSEGKIWMEEGEVEAVVRQTGEIITLQQSMYLEVAEDGEFESGVISDGELTELNESFSILDHDFIEKEIKLRFRDREGNTYEEDLQYYEQEEDQGH